MAVEAQIYLVIDYDIDSENGTFLVYLEGFQTADFPGKCESIKHYIIYILWIKILKPVEKLQEFTFWIFEVLDLKKVLSSASKCKNKKWVRQKPFLSKQFIANNH